MRIRFRTILLGLVGLLVLLVLGAVTSVGWQVVLGPHKRAVTDQKIEPTPARRARGEYLVQHVAACFHCHSEHDLTNPEYPVAPGRMGAGWVLPIPELNSIAAPNITPDPETGIGAWTDDEILRAIQEGIAKDGSALFPVMPYMNFGRMDAEDAKSIVVYLRTIPPVRNQVPVRTLPFPLSVLVNTMPEPITSHDTVPRTTPAARGDYLVNNIASCQDCHTPTHQGQPLPGMNFAGGGHFNDPGNQMKDVISLNITADPSGIAHYDEALFLQVLHSGQVPGRMVNHIMPFENFSGMTDDDLKDIFAYLKTVTPVKHRVSNTDPPKPCPICKQTHGLGQLNAAPAK